MDELKLRILRRVIIDPSTGCWEWRGATRGGYGSIYHRGKMVRTHRAMLGSPPGVYVCHHCDNPSCCRPSHLFAGSQADNMRDLASKGRHRDQRGERNSLAKLTDASVREIRNSAGGNAECAREHGVTTSTIRRVRRRVLWEHVE